MVLVHINPLLKKDSDLNIASARQIFPNIEMGVDRMELDF
jgi:hypothetical protein